MFDILVDSRSDQKTMHFLERKKKRNKRTDAFYYTYRAQVLLKRRRVRNTPYDQ